MSTRISIIYYFTIILVGKQSFQNSYLRNRKQLVLSVIDNIKMWSEHRWHTPQSPHVPFFL